MSEKSRPHMRAKDIPVVENVPLQPGQAGFIVAINLDPDTFEPTLMVGKRPENTAEVARAFNKILEFGEVLHLIGVEQALKFFASGLQFLKGSLDPDEIDKFHVVLLRFSSWFFVEDWVVTAEDRLIGFSYRLLKAQVLGWPEAAAIAELRLGKPISPNTWRMRVGRWADLHGLPPVQFRHRQQRQEQT